MDYEPNIANIRFRLAELYLIKEDWWRADYHYRLALAHKDLPLPVQYRIRQALYYIRKNKNWNVWFNFGIAPDNNINNTTAGEQCVMTMFGVMCNTLDEPEKDVGFNITVGGNYEFKLSENWRLRNEAFVYNAKYSDKKYDDTYLYYVLGLKYVYEKGDIFFGPTVSRRYLGHKAYNYSTGFMIETGYDITRQLNANLTLAYTPTYYDDYPDILDGDTKSARLRLFYALDSSMAMNMKKQKIGLIPMTELILHWDLVLSFLMVSMFMPNRLYCLQTIKVSAGRLKIISLSKLKKEMSRNAILSLYPTATCLSGE